MTELFLDIVNMSVSAGWLVLAVLVLRLLLLRSPKWVNVLLWGIVAVRLICPFSIESGFSLMPESLSSGALVKEWTDDYIGHNHFINEDSDYYDDAVAAGREPIPDGEGGHYVATGADRISAPSTVRNTVVPKLAVVWGIGMSLMAVYTVVSYLSLRHKLRTAVILRDNIFQCETVSSPFVLGILKPRIYLRYNTQEQNLNYVIAHEQAHIRRKDHWWKPLGFLLLTIHWFNPLMWVAYILLCRDIELACDEKVIAELGNEQRADYTQALVACAVNRRMIAACPLAFGEVGVKERVKSIMNYRKPTFWIIIMALAVCVLVAVCFLTDPFEPVLNDILFQNGYYVISENEQEVTLSVPKASLPDEIYTSEGYEFDEGEVVAYQTDTSTVYLRKAMLSNESTEQLYFAFDIAYDIGDRGTILSIYARVPDDKITFYGGLCSKDLRDSNTVYRDTVKTRGHGPDSQFWFYVSADACRKANGVLQFEVNFNEIEYEADQRNRSFSMTGDNVSDLNPAGIVERILKTEGWKSSNVYVNSHNFDLQVDANFNWMDSQAVRYFFSDAKKTYSSQLRIFPDEDKYFLTERTGWNAQEQKFLLQYYLEAIKYLPQDAIRELAPGDKYIIQQREEGRPSDYSRVITYSSEGVEDTDGWYIHLQIQPLHADREAFSGTGDEVLHVFYGESIGKFSGHAEKWFDYTEDHSAMFYEEELKIQLDEFPDITFRYTPYDITASWNNGDTAGKTYLISGLPIWNAYFCDLTGDGLPEICSQVSYGSGIIDNRVIIHDYANGASYSLIDRGYHDYYLRMNDADGYLYVDKRVYRSDELVSSGRLVYQDGCIMVEETDIHASLIMLPTDNKLQGLHAGALLLPMEGNTYRYLLTDNTGEGVTADKLIFEFTEPDLNRTINWEVYSLKEYPDLSVVMVLSKEEGPWLCTYSPPGRCSDTALSDAINVGYVVMEDGAATHGQDVWNAFYDKTQQGKPASVTVAHYYTLDPERCDSAYYATYSQDYPCLYEYRLEYNGKTFTLTEQDGSDVQIRTFAYLMKYDNTEFYPRSSTIPGRRFDYVLTHDNKVTWEQLFNGLVSSQMGAYIDHYSIYSERIQ